MRGSLSSLSRPLCDGRVKAFYHDNTLCWACYWLPLAASLLKLSNAQRKYLLLNHPLCLFRPLLCNISIFGFHTKQRAAHTLETPQHADDHFCSYAPFCAHHHHHLGSMLSLFLLLPDSSD